MAKLKVHSVRYNFIMNFILTASGFIFPLITFPYVSMVLGAEANGKLSFVTSYVAYFLMVAQLGIPTYGVRACARVRDDKDKLSKTAQEIFIINAVMSALVLASYIASILMVPSLAENRTLLFIFSVTIAMNCLSMEWFYKAIEQYDYITIRSLIFKIISIVLMFIFVHQAADYVIYGLITVISQVGSYSLNFIRVRKYIRVKPYRNYHFKRHFKPLILLFAQTAAISVYTNLDTIMLGFMNTYTQVGYYSASLRLQNITTSLVSSLGAVLLPRMSYYVKHKQSDKFLSLMGKALNYSVFISIPIALYIAIMSKDVITFIAGSDYTNAVGSIIFLSLAVIPVGLTIILANQVLIPLNKEKFVLISVAVGAVVDLSLNAFWIPIYGATGAALSTLICEYSVLVVDLIFTWNLLVRVRKTIFIYKYIIIGIISAIPIYFVRYIDVPYPIIRLLIAGVILAAIYTVGLFLIKDSIVVEVFHLIKDKIKGKKHNKNPEEQIEENNSEVIMDNLFDSKKDGDGPEYSKGSKKKDTFIDDLFEESNAGIEEDENKE